MMSHGLHYSVALMTLLLQLDVFLHYDMKRYSNKCIFISFILAGNDIKPLKSMVYSVLN